MIPNRTNSAGSGGMAPRIGGRRDARRAPGSATVDADPLGALEKIVSRRRFAPNQVIFEEGEAAEYVFSVASGNVRLCKLLSDGRRQITGFLRAGDFLGLVKRDAYAYTAEAIDAVELRCMRIINLERLLREMPVMRDRLLEISTDELAAAQEQMLLLGRKSTREKLVSFLLQQSQRDARAGPPGSLTIHLPMSRVDIADYLGLTVETVSRTFTVLKKQGLIELPVANRIVVPDFGRFAAAADAKPGDGGAA